MAGKDLLVALILLLVMSLTLFLTPRFIALLQHDSFFVSKNFEGKKIITAGGLIILPVVLIPLLLYNHTESDRLFFLIFLTGITVLALLDDLFGEGSYKGFRGHFKLLWKEKKISTGFLKAVGGGFLALFVAANIGGTNNNIYWFVRAAVLALYANLFNLLDTRPALAIKFFYLFSLVFAILDVGGHIFLILLLWGSLYVYLPFELSRKIMLGDTGAYLLGGIVGFIAISLFSPGTLYINFFFLLLLHLLFEKYSLSSFLDRVTRKE